MEDATRLGSDRTTTISTELGMPQLSIPFHKYK